jgi:hypothetical protein
VLDGSNVTSDYLTSMMAYDLSYIRVEYGTVLDTEGRVLLDINFNRTGQCYDPLGTVSSIGGQPHRGTVGDGC